MEAINLGRGGLTTMNEAELLETMGWRFQPVDLSGSDVHVTAGQSLSFVLRTESGAGVCNHLTQQCVEGDVGQSCSFDVECERVMLAGTNHGLYPDGDLRVNGSGSTQDLAFKVVERVESPGAGVSLSWTGGASPYTVFRSSLPATLPDPMNVIATTPATSLDDVPPPAQLWCYEVRNQP